MNQNKTLAQAARKLSIKQTAAHEIIKKYKESAICKDKKKPKYDTMPKKEEQIISMNSLEKA